MLLTPEQLEEIRRIIEEHHDAFMVDAISPDAVPEEVLEKLKEKGLVDPKIESLKDAYIYGQLVGILNNAKVASMSYEDFKRHVAKNPVPLTPAEEQAVKMAVAKAGQYAKGLGNVVSQRAGSIIIDGDAALRAETLDGIRDATAMNIAKRQTVKQLKSDLGWMAKDWARDWDRIAITEKHDAMQRGLADHYRKLHGGDSLVAKRPMPDACKHCQRLHIGPDGQPRIFKLSTLEANGTNVGRKAGDWKAVIGPVHPHCQCQLIRVPAGWGFDEEGDLVPGGELGERYESEEELTLAMLQEMDLQKAFQIQDRIDYQGIPIDIENRVGSIRKWKDAQGGTGETEMMVAYGYIRNTNGTDEDEIDVFVGPDPRAEMVYVIEQQNPENGLYDEQKCMLGFPNQQAAEQCYREHYNRMDFALYTSPMDMEQFKRWTRVTRAIEGNMLKSQEPATVGLRYVVPLTKGKRLIDIPEMCEETELSKALEENLSKARVDAVMGAMTSQAGNRNPSPGTASNIINLFPKKEMPAKKASTETGYFPDKDSLDQEDEEENKKNLRDAMTQDKEVYTVREPLRREPQPMDVPDHWKEDKGALEGAEDNKKQVQAWAERNNPPANSPPTKKPVKRTPVRYPSKRNRS